jgi:putative chitinase
MITSTQLITIMPYARARVPLFLGMLNETCHEFDISTPARVCAYLAQVGHESGQLRYVEELASGDAYEGRKDLGNTQPGDGRRFKGHGLIQITGRANHQKVADFFGKSLDDVVAWLVTPEGATRSSGWFWSTHHCNELADAGDFASLTRRINGGLNGLADRQALYDRAINTLGAA